jgi:hypothetical protein
MNTTKEETKRWKRREWEWEGKEGKEEPDE